MARPSSPLLILAATAALALQSAQGFLLPNPSSSSSRNTAAAARARTPLAALHAMPPKADFDMELFSPAKVNLFLRIIRRREDGYHELASLFQTVGFGDTLLFKASPSSIEIGLDCSIDWRND